METGKMESLAYVVPPENQGQIVEVSYAQADDGSIVVRTLDRSDMSTTYEVRELADGAEYEPQNDIPILAGQTRD